MPQFIGQQIGLEARFSDLVRFGLFGGHAEQGQQADDGERQAKSHPFKGVSSQMR